MKFPLDPASSTGVAESIATYRCKPLISQIVFKPQKIEIKQKKYIQITFTS